MSEPTLKNCDQYLDKLARIFTRASKKDQSRILALAARVRNERVACVTRLQAEADLIARLTEDPSTNHE